MNKKIAPVLAAVILIIILAAIGIVSKIAERYTPSKERMDAVEYFGAAKENEVALILQDELVTAKGFLQDGQPYLNYEVVKGYLNKKFYWDVDAQLMVYTTPTDIIHIGVGSRDYTLSGNTVKSDYEIVKTEGGEVYIAAAFVQQYTNMEYELVEEPKRLLITYEWGDQIYADIKSEESVRYQGGIKSPILTDVKPGDQVRVIEALDDWTKVMTADGYIGYVPNKKLGEAYTKTTSREFDQPVYSNIKKDYKINLVWHQTTSQDSNYNLSNDIANMTGVNTISPTWFSISNNDGDITSLASEDYVTNAHAKGMEVWALVDNFSEEISTTTVLASTAARENLSNQLIAAALQYKLDGINIDFEAISEEAGEGYIQFIREMSVKCRNNGIVLSIDDPVPMPFTAHYDRAEQGNVADYVIIMGYDEHYVGSEAGSVASLPFVKAGIEDTLQEVPAEKTINGIPFYTRLWHTDGQGEVTSEAVGMDTADSWITENSLTANWSEDTAQDYAEKEDGAGGKYQIWLENEKSIEEKMKLVEEYNLGGVAAWKLGLERSSIWEVISKYVG